MRAEAPARRGGCAGASRGRIEPWEVVLELVPRRLGADEDLSFDPSARVVVKRTHGDDRDPARRGAPDPQTWQKAWAKNCASGSFQVTTRSSPRSSRTRSMEVNPAPWRQDMHDWTTETRTDYECKGFASRSGFGRKPARSAMAAAESASAAKRTESVFSTVAEAANSAVGAASALQQVLLSLVEPTEKAKLLKWLRETDSGQP